LKKDPRYVSVFFSSVARHTRTHTYNHASFNSYIYIHVVTKTQVIFDILLKIIRKKNVRLYYFVFKYMYRSSPRSRNDAYIYTHPHEYIYLHNITVWLYERFYFYFYGYSTTTTTATTTITVGGIVSLSLFRRNLRAENVFNKTGARPEIVFDHFGVSAHVPDGWPETFYWPFIPLTLRCFECPGVNERRINFRTPNIAVLR